MTNRYRCRAFRTGEIDPFYTCIVMFDTHSEATAYVFTLMASKHTPADRVTAEWLFAPDEES